MVITNLNSLTSKIFEEIQKGKQLSQLSHLLKQYNGNDWSQYVNFSSDNYFKKLVHQNSYFDLFIISWKKGQKTKIHDHPINGCLMKVLDGQLNENIYKFDPLGCNPYPQRDLPCGQGDHPCPNLTHTDTNILSIGHIGYKESNMILHEIYSPINSVSLHIYSPSGYQAKCYN